MDRCSVSVNTPSFGGLAGRFLSLWEVHTWHNVRGYLGGDLLLRSVSVNLGVSRGSGIGSQSVAKM